MSVLRPHPILTTSGHAYDTNKMIVQLRMLSGRYRVGSLLRHFSAEHSGLCELCGREAEDIVHLVVQETGARVHASKVTGPSEEILGSTVLMRTMKLA